MFLAVDQAPPPRPNLADTVADVARAVRRDVKYGADWIKLIATGGVMDPMSDFNAQELSGEYSGRPPYGGITVMSSRLCKKPAGAVLKKPCVGDTPSASVGLTCAAVSGMMLKHRRRRREPCLIFEV